MKELSEKEFLIKAAAYCSAAERCYAEVASKLSGWGAPEELTVRILERLTAENYMDEKRFCRSFVQDKFRFNKWGKLKIEQALRAKRIAPGVIRESLSQIDEAEYLHTLADLIRGKRNYVKARDSYELYGKLVRFASGRGFELNDIRQCIDSGGDVEMD